MTLNRLVERGEKLARERQRRRIAELAGRLRELVGAASVDVADTYLMVRGKGMLQRWLTDPNLRFLGRGPR